MSIVRFNTIAVGDDEIALQLFKSDANNDECLIYYMTRVLFHPSFQLEFLHFVHTLCHTIFNQELVSLWNISKIPFLFYIFSGYNNSSNNKKKLK